MGKVKSADIKFAAELANLIEGHCIEDDAGSWRWVLRAESGLSMDGSRVYVRAIYRHCITSTSRIVRHLVDTTYTREVQGGILVADFGDRVEEYGEWTIADGEKRALPEQFFARCPSCGKRYTSAWYRTGYVERKEDHPTPPDRQGLDSVDCPFCAARASYRQWVLTPAPKWVLAGPEKWLAIKGGT